MSVHANFLAASQAAEESLEFLCCADSMAKRGEQADARACLEGVAVFSTSYLSDVLHEMKGDLAGVAEGEIVIRGPGNPLYYSSAHEAVGSLWLTIYTLCHQPDMTVSRDLLHWLGVNPSALHASLNRERAKLLQQEATKTALLKVMNADQSLPTEPPASIARQKEEADTDVPQYVTRDQIAAIVQRHKETVADWFNDDDNSPQPSIEGGGGKAHQYIWADVRLWLEEKSGRVLPPRYPHLTPS